MNTDPHGLEKGGTAAGFLSLLSVFIGVYPWLPLLLGCGPGNPLGRVAVEGRVTLDGAALDQGTISFTPQEARGVSSGATIKDGEYAIAAERGLPPGKYVVRINSGKPAAAAGSAPAAPGPAPPGIERIAPAYNAESKIVVEVIAGKKATFEFDTKSK